MTELHPLLQRLLKRCSIDPAELDNRWTELAKRISRTYVDNDEDRYLRERSLDISSREMQELNAALAAELEVARNLQCSILPRDIDTSAYEIAARMIPATEVGGDYYDVIPTDDGCFIGIGDVAGHGLRAAVIMTMVQSMTAVMIRQNPKIAPRDVMIAVNQALRENVFRRMAFDNHVTMTLFHCAADGTVTHAGAHEPILVFRADAEPDAPPEEIATPGTWLGPIDDISLVTLDRTFQLAPGDVMLLHTDGITEARNAKREQFGLDRMVASVQSRHAPTICDAVLASLRAWTLTQEDDVTVLAYRRHV